MNKMFSEWLGENALGGGHFFRAMSQIYFSIAVLDLNSQTSVVLSSQFNRDLAGYEMPWEELMELFVERHIYQEDRAAVYALFSAASLSLLCESHVNDKYMEVRCQSTEADRYEWAELAATVFDREARQIMITTRSISEAKVQKQVIDQFLYYQNCDFFLLLNLEENNYKIFDVKAGLLPVPDMGCLDYTADMIKYNNQYVVRSEAERVTSLMSLESIRELLEDQDEYSFTSGIVTDSGEYRRAKIQFIAFDRTKHLVIISRTDVTGIYLEEKSRNDQLVRAMSAAQRDMLTGLYNQTTTAEVVTQMLSGYQGDLAAVLFIDVDNFKMVNDNLGHLMGNELLKSIAGVLADIASKNGIAGRVGGDEFLLFLPDVTSMQELYRIGQAICGAFSGFEKMTAGLPVSCSVGISLYPQDGIDYEVLARKADQALYCAKRYGKNHYFLYSEEIETHKYFTALSKIDEEKQ